MSDDALNFLLVDDDPVFTRVMARGLQRRGHTAHCAASAQQALQLSRECRPSHILLDLNMPEVSGLVVLPELLAIAPQAKLVVLTGYSSIATAVQAEYKDYRYF